VLFDKDVELNVESVSFHTLPSDWKITDCSFRAVCLSCNMIVISRAIKENGIDDDLWKEMSERVRRDELDYVFHCGDQES